MDRLPAFCATITPAEGYPHALRDTLIKRWLLSIAAAAVLPDGFRCRGVLTLQGPQGIGKTSWGRKLITDPRLAAELIKVDHHLDAGNKDSQIIAIEQRIVEIGELESTLKRDVARLKGFITNGTDKIRRPYGREAVETQRRTVFYATVNGSDFLVDPTGNTRFWTISCARIDYNHDLDMQQVFAQCAVLLQQGEQWWLTAEEEALLERQNAQYRSYSLVRDQISGIIAFDDPTSANLRSMTASEVLLAAGFAHPTNPQAKECASLLREWFGESFRVNGRNKWRVPLHASVLTEEDSDRASFQRKSKFD